MQLVSDVAVEVLTAKKPIPFGADENRYREFLVTNVVMFGLLPEVKLQSVPSLISL